LLDQAGVPQGTVPDGGKRAHVPDGAPAPGRNGILFLIGSAGLKRDFGLETYSHLVTEILRKLPDRPMEVVAGPGDGDIAVRVRAETGIAAQSHPLPRLIHLLRSYEGTVLCFNSFSAHICHYLGRP